MHPVIIQAAAADRSRDMQEHAAAWRRARETRRAPRPWPFMRIPGVGRGPEVPARAAAAARSGRSLRPSLGAM